MLLIKIGGAKNLNWKAIAEDLSNLSEPFILVHGANEHMKDITEAMGKEVRMITSPSGFTSRYSDKETMDIFLQAYCGMVNKRWVELLQQNGINAVGLSGIDGGLWRGKRKDKIIGKLDGESKIKVIRDNFTGNVEEVNTKLIDILISNDFMPVLTAPAISYDNEIMNIDNDRAVAVMVKDLKIKKMVMLFGAPGLLKDHKDETSLIKNISSTELDEMMQYADGRMKKKVLGAQEAFKNGLESMYWGDGRIESPISSSLEGKGTVIKI